MAAFQITLGRTRKGHEYIALGSGRFYVKVPAPPGLTPQREVLLKALVDALAEQQKRIAALRGAPS